MDMGVELQRGAVALEQTDCCAERLWDADFFSLPPLPSKNGVQTDAEDGAKVLSIMGEPEAKRLGEGYRPLSVRRLRQDVVEETYRLPVSLPPTDFNRPRSR